MLNVRKWSFVLLVFAATAPTALAQRGWRDASHIIVPQSRGFAMRPGNPEIQVTGVRAEVRILDRTATTRLDISVHNPGPRPAEAVLLLPVPDGAAVSRFLFQGAASEPTADLLPKDEARRTYDAIVAKTRDPALLEFAGYALVRSSVFPVPAQGDQKVSLTYEHLLEGDGARADYRIPRSESLAVKVPWEIEVDLTATASIASVYSPSHPLESVELSPKHHRVRVPRSAQSEVGPFLLSFVSTNEGIGASLFAYPDPAGGGGYFLLMAGLPQPSSKEVRSLAREVTLVIDRSGSMAGGKLDQALSASLQVIEGLQENETFNILDYSNEVAAFSPRPVLRTERAIETVREYLKSLKPGGGTNIHDALVEALRQPPSEGRLPLVFFLTDGLPTIGQTSEVTIRELAEKANPFERRIFTFGVGEDVNVPLLDHIAENSKAKSVYVLPGEDVETKVAQVYKQLWGPVFAGLQYAMLDAEGKESTRVVRDPMPSELPDLFEGDQLVLLGRYLGQEPLRFQLSGNFRGKSRRFRFDFDLDKATTRNAFVPRLWASRRIAELVDEVRQSGAEGLSEVERQKMRELTDEIVHLSTRFGILSEYTAFLALEGTDLSQWDLLVTGCAFNLDQRAVNSRSGRAAVVQGLNNVQQRGQQWLNYSNRYLGDDLAQVQHTTIQQVCDRAFLNRGGQWIDTRLIAEQKALEATEVIEFGTPEHQALLETLQGEGRQAVLSLEGEVLLEHGGRNVLVRNRR
ncbi:MAG: VIT domain-containing protein [Planctomycetota bacterium]